MAAGMTSREAAAEQGGRAAGAGGSRSPAQARAGVQPARQRVAVGLGSRGGAAVNEGAADFGASERPAARPAAAYFEAPERPAAWPAAFGGRSQARSSTPELGEPVATGLRHRRARVFSRRGVGSPLAWGAAAALIGAKEAEFGAPERPAARLAAIRGCSRAWSSSCACRWQPVSATGARGCTAGAA
jgi:hypothetical protein